jgi:hypothetical protein
MIEVSNLSAKFEKTVVDKKLSTVNEVKVSMNSRNSIKHNTKWWTIILRLVEELSLMNSNYCLKDHQ